MAHEGDDIRFAEPDPVDEAFAYAHAGIIHEALDRVTDLETSLPLALFRPFRGNQVEAATQRIQNTRQKAGREFDEIERVVAANRHQGEVLSYLFNYSPGEYDPRVVAQAFGDLDFQGETASWDIQEMVRSTYSRQPSDKLQRVTFHVFDSLSAEPQPPGKSVRRALDWLGFNTPIAADPQFNRNRRRDASGNTETYATIFPQIDVGDGPVDQDRLSLTAHYGQNGPDVAMSVVVAIQPLSR